MEIIEHAIIEPCEGVLVEPMGGSGVGVLVLAGSSGRIDTERCRVLARAGMTALSIRWFGGDGQAQGICEIPLEGFVEAIDLLQARTGGESVYWDCPREPRRHSCWPSATRASMRWWPCLPPPWPGRTSAPASMV